jgi:murein DD-endopeptidase MepM/ murein hydrolase activator NlpD
MTGTVVYVRDSLPDNNGDLQDNNQGNNEVIVQHPNNVFSRYAHVRQGTATVHVGQTVYAGSVIGLVGNAGASSEPHLHFAVFKLDATGRAAAVPFTVPGMKSATGASVSGVPKARFIYQTP